MLWMLEAGHTPQFLAAHLNSDADVAAAVLQEISLLEQKGQHDLASELQRKVGGVPSKAVECGLQHYGQGVQLRGRLRRLNQQRSAQTSAATESEDHVLATATALLKSKQINAALQLLSSHAAANPYSPQIEQALAETAEAEENWIGARDHWHNILQSSPSDLTSVHARQRLHTLEASEAFKQQRVAMSFDHLLFEERFLTHLETSPLAFNSASDAAAAFWQHDESAEALLSPEINPLIWSDFRSGSGLQQAARYWLVQKLFHGRCLLEAIGMNGGIPLEAMKQRCSSSFDSDFYWTQRAEWGLEKKNAFVHYLEDGWKEGLSPNSTFDNEAALQQNPLLRNVGMNPLYFAICAGDSDVQQRLLKETISRFGHGTAVAQNSQDESGITHLRKFPESSYFNPRFTWFTASPSGDHSSLDLHWVIPDFGAGGGGHMTIFRMVRHLERQGHRITIWVLDPLRSRHSADLRDDVLKHYQPIKAKVLPMDSSFFFSSGDAVIATSWQTVEMVKQAQGFKERFYFIQDYEPYFYARGSEAVLAEATYSQGLACICASPWLDQMMRERFRTWSRPFWLAYDKRIYTCGTEQLRERCLRQQANDHIFHLAVYVVSRNGVVWNCLRRLSGFARNGRTSWCTCSAIHARLSVWDFQRSTTG